MLLDKVQSDLNAAMKAHDQARVDTLRFLLGAVKNFGIEKYPSSSRTGGISEGQSPPGLTDDDVLSVISKQVKSHKESIEMFKQGNRPELVEKETAQLAILQGYLPAQKSEQEIKSKIEEIKSSNPGADFPTLIKLAMGELRGKADGSVVSRLLRDIMAS